MAKKTQLEVIKMCTKCKEEKTLLEFSKRKASNDGFASRCKVCRAEEGKQYRANNPEKIREAKRKWWSTASDQQKENTQRWQRNNSKKEKARKKQWIIDNPDKMKTARNNWDLANKDKKAAHCAKRRAARLQRTPEWLTKEDLNKIERKYRTARIMTNLTKIKHCVDHCIPLQGTLVSGFHTPENLQVITVEKNLRKSNKFNPGVY